MQRPPGAWPPGARPPGVIKVSRRKSDGPANTIKVTKYYDNDNSCYSCGYDVSRNHTSKTCRFPLIGHDPNHTAENPSADHIPKDIEFSKYNHPNNLMLTGDPVKFGLPPRVVGT